MMPHKYFTVSEPASGELHIKRIPKLSKGDLKAGKKPEYHTYCGKQVPDDGSWTMGYNNPATCQECLEKHEAKAEC